MNEKFKIVIVSIMLISCIFLTFYFHFVVKTQIVFTHLFYIPIVISSIYWRKTGIIIALFLGLLVLISQTVSLLPVTFSDIIRSIMFVVISLIVSVIMNKNKHMALKLKNSEEFIALNEKLKENNKKLQLANKLADLREMQLKEMNHTKDKLFSIIAHDLRSPFNSILGFTDLLINEYKDLDSKKNEEYLKLINLTSKHTLFLLENLLDWAKIQTGQTNFKPEPLNLKPIIDEIIELYYAPANLKKISLQSQINGTPKIFADKNMIQTIFRNLVTNAIKYTHSEGYIVIKTVSVNRFVEISIIDSGIGMSPEIKEKLFNNKTFDSTVGTANEKGSGLGLILCKEFVEKHDGTLWVVSEVGKGSQFIFTLPEGIENN